MKEKSQYPSEPMTCKYCKQNILPKASKCHKCGSYQKAWKNWIAYGPLIVSIVMVIVAVVQLSLAWQKQISASKAFKKAINAETVARSAMKKTQDLYQQAKSRVDEIETMVKKTRSTIDYLKSFNEFSLTLTKANNDDREAFNKLKSWTKDHIFSDLANSAIIKIRASYARVFFIPGYLSISWKEEVNPSKLTFQVLLEEYKSIPPRYHADLVNYIWKRKDIPIKDRMQFLVDVLKKGKSLTAVYYAGKLFAKETKNEWSPFVIKPLIEWWWENKDKIKQ